MVRTFIYCRSQGNQNSSGLQCEVAYWPVLAVGSTAHLATTHCKNEWTLDPQSAARQTHLYQAALWSSPRNVLWQRLTILTCKYYQVLTATDLPTPEGWKAELATVYCCTHCVKYSLWII